MSSELQALIDAQLAGVQDAGQARLMEAGIRKALADGLISGIAARHGVTTSAVTGRHHSSRKHHVIMARSQTAYTLYANGFSHGQIAKLLGLSGDDQSIRSRQLWIDHLGGRLRTVTYDEGMEALAMIEAEGLSVFQAAERLNLSPARLRDRIKTIKSKRAKQ